MATAGSGEARERAAHGRIARGVETHFLRPDLKVLRERASRLVQKTPGVSPRRVPRLGVGEGHLQGCIPGFPGARMHRPRVGVEEVQLLACHDTEP